MAAAPSGGTPGGGPAGDQALVLVTDTPWGVRLTLNRPAKLNALSGPLVEALVDALDAAIADPRVRVIVLEGAGRAFSAGYDLTEESEGGVGGPVGWRRLLAVDVEATLRVLDCPKPVIAQIHGYALAGALELAMACDLIVAAEGTQVGEPEIRYGSAPVTLLIPNTRTRPRPTTRSPRCAGWSRTSPSTAANLRAGGGGRERRRQHRGAGGAARPRRGRAGAGRAGARLPADRPRRAHDVALEFAAGPLLSACSRRRHVRAHLGGPRWRPRPPAGSRGCRLTLVLTAERDPTRDEAED